MDWRSRKMANPCSRPTDQSSSGTSSSPATKYASRCAPTVRSGSASARIHRESSHLALAGHHRRKPSGADFELQGPRYLAQKTAVSGSPGSTIVRLSWLLIELQVIHRIVAAI